MKKRIIALMTVLALSISLSACGGNSPITKESEQEMKDSETENRELEVQLENGTTENTTKIEDAAKIEDDTKENTVQSGEIDPHNPPMNWGTPDGPEIAVKNYYADTVFELVSFEIVQASKEHVIFTVTSKKGGILVEPDRAIELRYEDEKWKVVDEGYFPNLPR